MRQSVARTGPGVQAAFPIRTHISQLRACPTPFPFPLAAHGLGAHAFPRQVRVCGQIIAMKDCYMIWIGSGNPSFANLDVAMCSNLDSMPVTSSLMSSGTEGDGGGGGAGVRANLVFGVCDCVCVISRRYMRDAHAVFA
jgi:hypothetical protein